MTHHRASTALALLAGLWLGGGTPVQGAVVGLAPFTRPGSPDFSQMYADNSFSPLSGHAAWWGDPSVPSTCGMCGPTTAADTAFWFADRHGNAGRLSQVQIGSDWVDATAGNVIEQFALKVGFHQNWDPQAGPFPGTRSDQAYIQGQADYYAERGVDVGFGYLTTAKTGYVDFFDHIVSALFDGKGVELSNLGPGNGHWFSIAGARTDEFDDRNGNGVFDAGDVWINDYDHDGQFDRYLWVNNPWPGHASQDWDNYVDVGGDYYLTGDSRPLDSVVFVGLLPEPGALSLALAAFAAAGSARRRLGWPTSGAGQGRGRMLPARLPGG